MSAFGTAWQAALQAEYQAVFAYALIGPHLPAGEQALARTCQAAHESVRDAVQSAMAAAGVTSVAAAADYPALYPVQNPGQALALAARVEDDCATAWRVTYAAAAVDGSQAKLVPNPPARRREAQSSLTAAATWAARWRKTAGVVPASRPFPGI